MSYELATLSDRFEKKKSANIEIKKFNRRKKEIASGNFGKIFLLEDEVSKKYVEKRFYKKEGWKEKEKLIKILEKLDENDIPHLKIFFDKENNSYSEFLNINNRVILSSNINIKPVLQRGEKEKDYGVIYFDNDGNKKRFNQKIQILNYDNIFNKMFEIIFKVSKSKIFLSADSFFYHLDLNKKNQDDLDILIGDYDMLKIENKLSFESLINNNLMVAWNSIESIFLYNIKIDSHKLWSVLEWDNLDYLEYNFNLSSEFSSQFRDFLAQKK